MDLIKKIKTPSPFRRIDSAKLIEIIAYLNLFLVLLPQLDGSFVWDDKMSASIVGAAKLHGLSGIGILARSIQLIFEGQSRFFPLSSLTLIPFFCLNRFFYKLWILALTLLNAGLFSRLIDRLTQDRTLKLLFLILVPTTLQVRVGPNAITGYSGLMQVVLIYTLFSCFSFLDYLSHQNKKDLLKSLAWFAAGLLSYEITYVFFLIPFALAFFNSPTVGLPASRDLKNRLKKAALLSLPFFLLTFVVIDLVLLLRFYHGINLLGENAAYQPQSSLFPMAATLLKHCISAIPTTFFTLSKWRSFNPWESDLEPTLTTCLNGWSIPLLLWLCFTEYFMLERLSRLLKGRSSQTCFILGGLFLILPGVLISLSSKYQSTLWTDWGIGYLPIYLSYFGAAALLTGILDHLCRFSKRRLVTVLFALVACCSLCLNYLNLKRVTFFNVSMREARELAEASLKRGILESIKQNSYLITDFNSLDVGYSQFNPAFFRSFQNTTLRKVALPSNYLGSPYVGDFASKLFFDTSTANIPLPDSQLLESNSTGALYSLVPENQVYYFRVNSLKGSVSYVVFGQISSYRANPNTLQGVTGPSAILYLQGNLSLPVSILVRSHIPGTKSFLPQESISIDSLPILKSGRNWKIIDLRSSHQGLSLDFRSLSLEGNGILDPHDPSVL